MTAESCDLLCIDLPRAEELRRQRPPVATLARMARQAQALGDPTRLGLAVALERGSELCVCDLAWISERPQNLVSHHLRALHVAGLAQSRREGKIVFYSLTAFGQRLLAEVAAGDPLEVVR